MCIESAKDSVKYTEIPLPAHTTTAYEGNLALQEIHISCA